MPGIRIQHALERSVTFSIADQDRPYPAPLDCQAPIVVAGELRPCARTHAFKTYHLNLDEAGAAIVSTTIWERMARKLILAGFHLANEVASPPAQILRVPSLLIRPRAISPGV